MYEMELGSVSAARSSVQRETMAGVGKCFLVTGSPVSITISTVTIQIKNDLS